MDEFALIPLDLHFFRFEVYGLFDFVEAALLQVAVAGDMGGDLESLPVGVRLNPGVDANAVTGLDLECA